MDPSPLDPSVLTLQHCHRSGPIWDGEAVKELHCRRQEAVVHRTIPLDPRIIPYLQRAGFYGVARVGFIQLDWHLITVFIERWCQETHTFHLTVGEATITLQDVELQFGLRVDGLPVTGSTDVDYGFLCAELLGFMSEEKERRGGRLSLVTLGERFSHLPEEATEFQIQQYARAYILQLIGGGLFSDQSNNLVHLCVLPLFADFDVAGTYTWGSAVLAWLYRQLCRAVDYRKQGVSGALVLIQLWAWDRFPYLAPQRRDIPRVDHAGPDAHLFPPPPLAYRWRHVLIRKDISTHVLNKYREALDTKGHHEVIWTPYSEELIDALPDYCKHGRAIWHTISLLICFAIVELHRPDRVLRQFGMRQVIPEPCDTSVDLHSCDMRGQCDTDWIQKHCHYVDQWERRAENLAVGDVFEHNAQAHLDYNDPYMIWYRSITRRWMTQSGATIDFLVQNMAQVSLRTRVNDMTTLSDIERILRTTLEMVHADYLVRGDTTAGPSSAYQRSPTTPSSRVDPFMTDQTTPLHMDPSTFANASTYTQLHSTFTSCEDNPMLGPEGDENVDLYQGTNWNAARNWIGRGKRLPRRGRGGGQGCTYLVIGGPVIEEHQQGHNDDDNISTMHVDDDPTAHQSRLADHVEPPIEEPLRYYTRNHLRHNKRRKWPICGTE